MEQAEKILSELGLKCSLGSWSNENGYYAICYNRKQGNTWVDKLTKAGYRASVYYEQYAYIVHFKK